MVEGLFRGENGLIFAYGVTNSGKTYTMQGEEKNPGLLTLAVRMIFNRLAEEKEAEVEDFTVTGSMLEIYNERIFDLLSTDRTECKLQRAASRDSVFVTGLKELSISNAVEAEAVLSTASKSRTTGKTGSNNSSSRSHTVFTLKLHRPGQKQVWARLSIVDLAGAERAKNTNNQGDRLAESFKINTSLMHLGRCLEILRENQKSKRPQPVPYRDSKITRLFQDSLSGWGHTVMIANTSAVSKDYDETVCMYVCVYYGLCIIMAITEG